MTTKTARVVQISAAILLLLALVGFLLYQYRRQRYFERSVNQAVKAVHEAYSGLVEKTDELDQGLGQCRSTLDSKSDKIEGLERLVTALQDDTADIRKRMTGISGDVFKLTQLLGMRIDEAKTEIDGLKERMDSIGDDIERCNIKIVNVAEVLEEIDRRSFANQQSVERLNGTVAELTSEVSRLQDKLTNEVNRLDSENRLVHYNYEVTLEMLKKGQTEVSAPDPKEVDQVLRREKDPLDPLDPLDEPEVIVAQKSGCGVFKRLFRFITFWRI